MVEQGWGRVVNVTTSFFTTPQVLVHGALRALLLHAGFKAVRFDRLGRIPAQGKSMTTVAERGYLLVAAFQEHSASRGTDAPARQES
jgi:hypothetical protein